MGETVSYLYATVENSLNLLKTVSLFIRESDTVFLLFVFSCVSFRLVDLVIEIRGICYSVLNCRTVLAIAPFRPLVRVCKVYTRRQQLGQLTTVVLGLL